METLKPKDLAALRRALGLNQPQMAQVLGLAHKSLARLEGRRDAQASDWLGGATVRLVSLLRALPVVAVPGQIRALAAITRQDRGFAAEDLASQVAIALDRARDSLEPIERIEAQGWRLGRLIDRSSQTRRIWVYWATSERADADATLGLAEEHGVICRPLLDAAGRPNDYLTRLQPNDLMLLYHDDAAMGWFRLQEAKSEIPRSLIRARGRAPKDIQRITESTPVIRFVRRSQPLGKLLATPAWGYRLYDNRPPDGARSTAFFSCLAVVAERNRPKARPQPRRPGERARITPYIEEA